VLVQELLDAKALSGSRRDHALIDSASETKMVLLTSAAAMEMESRAGITPPFAGLQADARRM
jgi:hypothetical protein